MASANKTAAKRKGWFKRLRENYPFLVMIFPAVLVVSERARGKAKTTAEEVAHGVGVGEAAEVGNAIKW